MTTESGEFSGAEGGEPLVPDWADGDLGGDGALAEVSDQLRPELTDREQLLSNRPSIKPAETVNAIVDQVSFRRRNEHWQVARDLVGMIRHGRDGEHETYIDKLRREHEKNGGRSQESASYGLAKIMGEKAVLFVMNWGYFAGSLGEVAGQKFVQAARLAVRRELPFVSIYASSGARQQENLLALAQMHRMALAVGWYKQHSHNPHIAVLAGQVWGGVSASAVPSADLLVALAGTDFGFSGPRVIETYQGSAVPKGSQSAEAAFLDRNVDAIASNPEELLTYLGRLLGTYRTKKHYKLGSEELREAEVLPEATSKQITVGPSGYAPLLPPNQTAEEIFDITPRKIRSEPENGRLWDLYESLLSDPGRVDTEFIMRHVFSDVTPLYNHYIVGDRKVYPPIIAGIGRIARQPFLIIGNQPSYQDRGNGIVKKLPANAGPEDFEYQIRMMKMGERLGLPLVFLTDTLGAKPTLASEQRGQSRAIADAIAANSVYPHEVVTIITGALGSGGGLATGALRERVLMLQNALAFVSEPSSAAAILYNIASPTREEIMRTLSTMSATAEDHRRLGLIDEIIPEDPNPHKTATNIRSALIKAFVELEGMSGRQRRRLTDTRLRPQGTNS